MSKKKDVKQQIRSHIKIAGHLAVGYSVGKFMGAVMQDFTPDAKGVKKIFIKIGALALTGMVVKAATDYIESEIDDIFDTVEEMSTELNKKMKEKKNGTDN